MCYMIILLPRIGFNKRMDIRKKLGKRIKEIRLQRSLSQEYVANKLDINPSNYSRIETGYSYPKAETLQKLCQALNVQPKDLFDFEHHKDLSSIKTELIDSIQQNDELAVLLYKFMKTVTF